MPAKKQAKTPSPCNCLNLRRAAQAISTVYDRALAPSGLKITQFSLMKHIRSQEPVSVSALAVAIRLDRTTLVRNLKPLEERGLVEDASAVGTRNRALWLTEEGNRTLEHAEAQWYAAQASFEEYLGADSLRQLTETLSRIEALEP